MVSINELEVELLCNNMLKICDADGIPRHVEIKVGDEVARVYNAKLRNGIWKAELDYVSPSHGLILRNS